MQCAGSVFATRDLPKPPQTDSAKEGDAAHEVTEHMFNAKVPPKFRKGVKASNGWVIDQDMFDAAAAYVGWIKSLSGERRVEEKADFEIVPGLAIRCRVDAMVWDANAQELHVVDFKYGWRPVEVVGNWQLIAGVVGICRALQINPVRIHMHIDQPRPFHPDGRRRTWTVTPDKLAPYYQQLEQRFATLTEELTSGPACTKCVAGPRHCPAARVAAYNSVDVSMSATMSELTAQEAAEELEIMERAAKLTKDRADWLRDVIETELRAGKVVKGFYLDKAYGRREWNDERSAIDLKKETGIKGLRKTVSVSPAEAKRLGVDDETLSKYTRRPERGVTLRRGDAAKKAKEVFGNGDN